VHLLDFDHLLRVWVVTHRLARIDRMMVMVSAAGRGGAVWLVLGTAFALMRRIAWRDWLQLALAIALASLATSVVRPLVARERPFVTSPEYSTIGPRPDDASFPSGHSANAGAGAFVLSQVVPAAAAAWWCLAALIAFSRVYVGVHYPLDVVAGLLFGAAVAAVVRKLAAHFMAPR